MPLIREPAPAKINLTLDVAGRRSDGLHEIASLVVFADVGDVVSLDPEGAPGVTVTGPFAAALSGSNILDTTLTLLAARAPHLALGAVRLEKVLPVAAGIGGGSADAAALLRAVRRLNGAAADAVDWYAMARGLGADVSVCLEARALWVTGVGHDLSEIAGGVPRLHAVLVNPLAQVPEDKTARVYRTLGAGPLPAGYWAAPAPQVPDRAQLLGFMRARGNRLAPAAEAVVAETGTVLTALRGAPGIEAAAVSGGGPTCFGVFPDRDRAQDARAHLAASHPEWWVAAVTLG